MLNIRWIVSHAFTPFLVCVMLGLSGALIAKAEPGARGSAKLGPR